MGPSTHTHKKIHPFISSPPNCKPPLANIEMKWIRLFTTFWILKLKWIRLFTTFWSFNCYEACLETLSFSSVISPPRTPYEVVQTLRVPRPHYCAGPMHFGSRGPSEFWSLGYVTEMHMIISPQWELNFHPDRRLLKVQPAAFVEMVIILHLG